MIRSMEYRDNEDFYDDYPDYADAPRQIRCMECEYKYDSDERECPECGSEDWEEVERVVIHCSHCGAKAFGDAHCNRCGNRVHYDYNNLETNSMEFADPGGNSALRAATPSNPRIYPCPDCGTPDVLTPSDRARGYCCDRCADRKEMGWDY